MKTLEDALYNGRMLLKEKGITEADLDAWYLLSYLFKISRTQFFMQPKAEIPDFEFEQYLKLIKERADHIPLQYITGSQEFMGLDFHVTKDVLIPRQDTEILVEEVLKVSEGKSVLDLCTGSGCILISLAKLGGIKRGMGVDISKKALAVAKENASRLEAAVTFIESDMFEEVRDKFDIIVSNPPYIPTKDVKELMEEVKGHEPKLALDGSEDGLFFYRIIANSLNEYLHPGGFIFFEIGYNQGESVKTLLQNAGVTDIRLRKDLAGLDRVISGRYKREEESFT
jgi:release factor glutamine methyltransferase